MFEFDFNDHLKKEIKVLNKKNPVLAEQLRKKVKQVISLDIGAINHFKNLRHDLSNQKRVHVGENFVLTFEVDIKTNFILFIKFEHRDSVYQH
jgi:mRNA-degrading endonuclease RelE of RelBE toxin-antitoxin system